VPRRTSIRTALANLTAAALRNRKPNEHRLRLFVAAAAIGSGMPTISLEYGAGDCTSIAPGPRVGCANAPDPDAWRRKVAQADLDLRSGAYDAARSVISTRRSGSI